MAARYGHLINKWTVAAVAALAVMAALLATVLPAWAQTTDPTIIRQTIYHEENKLLVDTFDAVGLTALKVFWYLEGADSSQFKVGSRTGRTTTLEFRRSPNYESPRDVENDEDGNGTTDTGEGAANNIYKVTLRGGDGGADESKIFEVTVVVTNAKEDGRITLTPIQPQAARLMTADLSDPDRADAAGRLYTWTSDVSSSGPFSTTLQGPAPDNTYRPSNADEGRFIRVEVTYRDGATRGDELAMAQATSDYMVRLQPSFNRAPTFPDQRPDTTVLTDYLTATRAVAEELPSGTLVGPPVTAVDHDGDVLTYTLGGADASQFDIDPKTGQITTDTGFDAEQTTPGADDNCAVVNACVVTVTATDPSGLNTVEPVVAGVTAGTLGTVVTVNIAITAVDEPPGGVGGTAAALVPPEDPVNNTHMYQDRPENLTIGGAQGATPAPTDLVTYTATDSDGTGRSEITWRLAGPDASEFNISSPGGILTFKDTPDYEDPADENGDNVYELIVVASDPQLNVSTLWVTIKVTNQEESGEVSFNQRQPAVGVPITASLDDEDGVAGGVRWQWHRVGAGDDTADITDLSPGSGTAISGATSATYTPVASDAGATSFLRAVATYEDEQERGATRNAGHTVATIADSTAAAPANAILAVPDAPGNQAPVIAEMTREFTVAERDRTTVITTITATDLVGDTTDASGQAQVYSIGGADAAYFRIGGSLADLSTADGALRVRVSPGLDYENMTRGGGRLPDRITYNITVKATDPFGATSAEVPVKITVTDVLEDANISVKSGAQIEHIGRNVAVSFDENGTGTVADLDAMDPDNDSIVWYIVPAADADAAANDPNLDPANAMSADGGMFVVNPQTGVLTFKIPPNYEDAEDGAADGTGDTFRDNIYQVMVKARSLDARDDDAGGDDEPDVINDKNDIHLIKVKVLDVPENPVFRVSTGARARDEDYGEELAATRGPNRPIGLPVTADDPDNPGTATPATDPATLTYTLEGSDAGSFGIVPATGQLLTRDVLDYEIRNMYDVTVKASDDTEMDPAKRDDTIAIGIEVQDVVEPNPVPLTVRGLAEVSYEENADVFVAEYNAVGQFAAAVTWHNPQGADGEYFMLEGPEAGGTSVMLKFRMPPDYENPRGMPMSDTNTNTYELTVDIEHTSTSSTATLPVTVTVTNAEELGDLSGMSSVSYVENDTVVVGTYTAGGPMAYNAMWSLAESDDMDLFTLDTDTGSSVMLMFAEPPNYEMPMDANSDNTYMVTLEAMVGGEMDMHDVTITVTDTNDMGTVTITPDPAMLRPGTMLTAEVDDEDGIPTPVTATWQWSKSMDMSSWMDISGATSMTYTPVDADHGYYLRAMVTYTDRYASDQTAMAMTTSKVNAVQDQMGSVSLSSMSPMVGTMLTATLSDPNGGITGATWQWSKSMDMAGTFMDITDATSMSYTPMAADEGYYLRATVMYTDAHGPGKSEMATTTAKVAPATPPDPNAALIARYDTNGTPGIQKDEVIRAINDYLFGGTHTLTKEQVIYLINCYLFGC